MVSYLDHVRNNNDTNPRQLNYIRTDDGDDIDESINHSTLFFIPYSIGVNWKSIPDSVKREMSWLLSAVFLYCPSEKEESNTILS